MNTPKRKTHTLTTNFTKQSAEKIRTAFLPLVEHDGALYLNASKSHSSMQQGYSSSTPVRDRKAPGRKTPTKCSSIVTSTIETFGLSAEFSVA